MKNVVICESAAAIITHYRVVTAQTPIKLGGHAMPRPLTLCGNEAAWDTQLPVTHRDGSFAATCKTCLSRVKEL